MDSGLKAAAWSPDEEMLVLVTGELVPYQERNAEYVGEDKLVCMTRMFDTILDEPLRTDDFGEGGLFPMSTPRSICQSLCLSRCFH